MRRKDWGKPGEEVEFTYVKDEVRTETIQKERCWQCRKHSLVFFECKRGWEVEHCLNNCGPRELCNMLKGFFS